jgi:hypothetical protein
MQPKKVIRCQSKIHTEHQGNILAAVEGNSLFIKCPDRGCRRWTRLTIIIPGIKFNLSEAGIVQDVMPEDYHLHLEPATVVVGRR